MDREQLKKRIVRIRLEKEQLEICKDQTTTSHMHCIWLDGQIFALENVLMDTKE